jgi:acyl-CoA synthetase (AMP-forming)/AMP-acid ligase II
MWRQDDLFLVNNRTARVRFPEDADRETVARLLSKPGPRHLPAVPLMHGLGQFTTYSAFCSAGAGVLLTGRRFDAIELLDTVERERVNSIVIAGDAVARPMLDALDAEPDRWDTTSVRVVSSSGAMWSEVVKAGLGKHLPLAVLVDTLGSSEAIGLGVSVSKAGSVAATARFTMGDDARVLADDGSWVEPGSGVRGLLARKGPTSIGYYKDAEKTAATYRLIDGVRWSTPGDYAMVEADGTISLLGRGSNCINTGGEKVYPEEVEEALKQHPSVRDAIVLGVPDDRLGERIVAAVELEAGEAFDQEALIAHVRSLLAAYKAPRQIRPAPSLERQPTGKLDYPAWKRRFEPG